MTSILITLGAISYVAIGAITARWLLGAGVSETPWWQIVAVVVLWPLIIGFAVVILGNL